MRTHRIIGDTMYSFEVLTVVIKNPNLHVAGYLDLPLVIEKIYGVEDICCAIVKEMEKILNVVLARSLSKQVFSTP